MTCPWCKAEVHDPYCGYCGGPVHARACPTCDADVQAGFRHCGQCGAEAGGGPRRKARTGGPLTAWWIAGGAVVLAVGVLALPALDLGSSGDGGGAPQEGGQTPEWAAPETRTPADEPGAPADEPAPGSREAADQLYDRVMWALAQGEREEAESLLPAALAAYDELGTLDADGHFHVALLRQAAGDPQGALEAAERILDDHPDHLLGLYAAGEAAADLDETSVAQERYARLLEVFEEERDRDLPEYREHAPMLPEARDEARAFLDEHGT